MPNYAVVRINRDRSDTYAVAVGGRSLMAAAYEAVELANPDKGATIEYGRVMARDAGAARLMTPNRGWLTLPEGDFYRTGPDSTDRARPGHRSARGRGNPVDGVLDGMEKALWVTSYADWTDNLDDDQRRRLRRQGKIPGPGGDWCDTAPTPPSSAKQAARELYNLFEKLNGPMEQLVEKAEAADGASIDEGDFGHYLAMQAMGHGVSWFDSHREFPIKFPRYFEAHSDDGRTLWWSPQASTSAPAPPPELPWRR